jgi:hypothetical protein
LRQGHGVVAEVALQVQDGEVRDVADLGLDDRIEAPAPRPVRGQVVAARSEMDRGAFVPVRPIEVLPVRCG